LRAYESVSDARRHRDRLTCARAGATQRIRTSGSPCLLSFRRLRGRCRRIDHQGDYDHQPAANPLKDRGLLFRKTRPPLSDTRLQPTRPPNKNDVDVWNHFIDQVDAYRACMSKFIAENNEAAERHRAAANAATEEWNTFVHSSLNVPEDFPWPPPYKPEPRETPKE
jgi:hypothetical protein